jgi:hypothetical protein
MTDANTVGIQPVLEPEAQAFVPVRPVRAGPAPPGRPSPHRSPARSGCGRQPRYASSRRSQTSLMVG